MTPEQLAVYRGKAIEAFERCAELHGQVVTTDSYFLVPPWAFDALRGLPYTLRRPKLYGYTARAQRGWRYWRLHRLRRERQADRAIYRSMAIQGFQREFGIRPNIVEETMKGGKLGFLIGISA